MRKFKYFTVIGLTLLLLISCALLPNLTAHLLDLRTQDQIVYEQIPEVQLNISQNEPLSALGKISLIREGQQLNITENQASLSDKDLLLVLEKALTPYQNVGVFPFSLSDLTIQALPSIAYQLNDPNVNMIFWSINLVSEDEKVQIHLILDDETGNLLSLYVYQDGEEPLYIDEDLPGLFMMLPPLYLTPWSLQPLDTNGEAFNPIVEEIDPAQSAYHYDDPQYGTITIRFCMSANGFTISLW